MAQDSVRAVEMAVELGIEKLRVSEAINARDAVVQRLSDAYVSLRQKVSIIDRLQEELGIPGRDDGTQRDNIRLNNEEIYRLNGVVTSLREEIRCLKDTATNTHATKSPGDPPPRYEEGKMDSFKVRQCSLYAPILIRMTFQERRRPRESHSRYPCTYTLSTLENRFITIQSSFPRSSWFFYRFNLTRNTR